MFSLRKTVILSPETFDISFPLKIYLPLSALSIPEIILRTVDFPEPDLPIIATISPVFTDKLNSFNTILSYHMISLYFLNLTMTNCIPPTHFL